MKRLRTSIAWLATAVGACTSLDGLTSTPDASVTDAGTDVATTDADAGAATGDAGDAGDGATCAADLQTDPTNCGACGHDCGGASCKSGACQPITLYHSQTDINALACDQSQVYWATDQGVYARPFTAAATPVTLANVVGRGIALFGDSAYFTSAGSLFRVPKNGGDAAVPVESDDASTYTQGIASDDTHVYVSHENGGVIRSYAPDGGAIATLFTGLSNPQAIASDNTEIFVFVFGPAILHRPLAGGASQYVSAPAPNQYTNLATDGTSVAWWTTDGVAARWNRSTGNVVLLADAGVRGIALDSQSALLALDDPPDAATPLGSIVRRAKDGSGPPVVVASDQLHPTFLTLCAGRLVWVVADQTPNASAIVWVAR